MKKSIKGTLILLFVSIIWGFAFIAQSEGITYINTFTLNFFRSLIAAISLYIYDIIINKARKTKTNKKQDNKLVLIAGLLSGIALFIATNAQQYGIKFTFAGKAGFLTALYIIFVPIFSLFLKKKISLNIWISVFISIIGCYFLCFDEKLTLGKGEIFIVLSSVFFAIQIITIDNFTQKVDGVKMSYIQFVVVALLSFFPMLFEKKSALDLYKALPSIFYLGLISSGVGYTLQIIGQKNVNPTVASLILSLESVFSIIFGVIFLFEIPTKYEIIGCILIFIAITLSQISFDKYSKTSKN